MKLLHTADWHLGLRQFSASAGGINVRETDVEAALTRLVSAALEEKPDLILVAGDVFHSVRPPNRSIVFLFAQLQRLRVGLPDTPIVVVSGNHDSARDIQAGAILPLYRALGVDVVTTAPAQLCRAGVVVTAVPSAAIGKLGTLAPEPGEINVLLAHGQVAGIAHGKGEVGAGTLGQPWSYIALGDYHCMTHVGGRAWYSGALEFTSSDPWSEAGKPKGYLVVELPDGEPVFRPIATRRFVDFEPLDAEGVAVPELNAAIRARIEDAEPDGAVLRLRVTNISRETQHALDHAMLRGLRARPLHLQFVWDRPAGAAATPEARTLRLKRLRDVVDEFFGARTLPPDVDRAAFQRQGAEYFAQSEAE